METLLIVHRVVIKRTTETNLWIHKPLNSLILTFYCREIKTYREIM